MKFILDTNILTALLKNEPQVFAKLEAHLSDGIYLCMPIYFEAMRGLIWKNASAKIATLQKLRARFGWLLLIDEDWDTAGRLWADAVSKGKQLRTWIC